MSKIIVTGAGGFIGGHLTKSLQEQGHEVIGIDVKPLDRWYQRYIEKAHIVDLRTTDAMYLANMFYGVDDVYNLAADMGGMGFIENHKLECMLSVNISTNVAWAAVMAGAKRFFYASSACVYPGYRQNTGYDAIQLKEEDAYPADPEDGYGWEKLFSERMAAHFNEETATNFAVARYHNVYGPNGTWTGGREKAPAAIARKVAEAVIHKKGAIEVWGNGQQRRSYMFIDDAVHGTQLIMDAGIVNPINLGSSEDVSVQELIMITEQVAGVEPGSLTRWYDMSKPQGVKSRNSDNDRIKAELNWEPNTKLLDGMEQTYRWVYDQVKAAA